MGCLIQVVPNKGLTVPWSQFTSKMEFSWKQLDIGLLLKMELTGTQLDISYFEDGTPGTQLDISYFEDRTYWEPALHQLL